MIDVTFNLHQFTLKMIDPIFNVNFFKFKIPDAGFNLIPQKHLKRAANPSYKPMQSR